MLRSLHHQSRVRLRSLPWVLAPRLSAIAIAGARVRVANVCYKRLASLIAQKRDQPYSRTMAWVRCSLSFALLRSSIQCIRGARSSIGQVDRELLPPVDLVTSEAKLPVWIPSFNIPSFNILFCNRCFFLFHFFPLFKKNFFFLRNLWSRATIA